MSKRNGITTVSVIVRDIERSGAAAGCEKLFEEKISGATRNRPKLEKLIEQLRKGDVLVVTRLDRLTRSTSELLRIAERITEKKAGLQSLDEPWADTTSPSGRMIMTVFAGIAEFERILILSRTQEGRLAAQARGVAFGRPRKRLWCTDHGRDGWGMMAWGVLPVTVQGELRAVQSQCRAPSSHPQADGVDGSRPRHLSAKVGCYRATRAEEPPGMDVTTIGIDLAKDVFQVHGIDAAGGVVVRKALRRAQVLPFFAKLSPCLVGMEACGTSHHWARELVALGHTVKMMPPTYVKAYVKRGKTDAADAEAICEAVTRPTMRFVAIKSREQQATLSMHRARPLVRARRRIRFDLHSSFATGDESASH